MNEILLMSFIERMVIALEAIAENTKPEDIEERDSRVTGFSAGEKKNV